MYTIKEVAAKVSESEHTIRYYCKEGLFPFPVRDKNNVRRFSEEDPEGVRIVLCLRDTGMPLAEIRHYMGLCTKGASTLSEWLEIIRRQKEEAYRQMAEFQKKIDHLEWKERHYLELIENGSGDDCNPLMHGAEIQSNGVTDGGERFCTIYGIPGTAAKNAARAARTAICIIWTVCGEKTAGIFTGPRQASIIRCPRTKPGITR